MGRDTRKGSRDPTVEVGFREQASQWLGWQTERLRRRPGEATLPTVLLAVVPLQCPEGLRLQRSGGTELLANWGRQ